jgi:flagellar hook protein FlgE
MGFPTDKNGVPIQTNTPQKLTVPTAGPIGANVTTTIGAEFNLDSRAPIAASLATPTPRSTYGTSITTYDTQGNALPVSLYFTKVDPATTPLGVTTPLTDQWAVYDHLDTATTTFTPIAYMAFNGAGALSTVYDNVAGGPTTALGQLPITVVNPNTTAGDIAPTVDLSKVTQFGVNFSVSNLTQDGYTSGEFTGLAIDEKGVITTRYSNGQTLKSGGMIALANFRNMQGLQPVGSGEYLETFKSGTRVLGQPTVGQFGQLRAGAVEESNVDLTSELVNMMTAQRNYQANAQTIKTQDQVMSTLVNLR